MCLSGLRSRQALALREVASTTIRHAAAAPPPSPLPAPLCVSCQRPGELVSSWTVRSSWPTWGAAGGTRSVLPTKSVQTFHCALQSIHLSVHQGGGRSLYLQRLHASR